MPRVLLTLEYDGTDFVGWQRQPNGRSVQAVLEEGLEKLLGVPTPVRAAARTDAGVHALGQKVAFDSPRALPMKAYAVGLTNILPEDVGVVRAEEVADGYDPRRDSAGKRYRYLISNLGHPSPLRRRTHWELFQPLDLPAMERAARALVGRHDYSAFRAANCQAAHAVRELTRVEWTRGGEGELVLWVEGTAFLKQMVRAIVGTLVEVGRAREPAEWVARVLASKDRTQAGQTAPPQGLTLMEVFLGRGAAERPAPEEPDEE